MEKSGGRNIVKTDWNEFKLMRFLEKVELSHFNMSINIVTALQ